MFSWFWKWNKFQNRSIFEVKAYKTKCASFLGHPVCGTLPERLRDPTLSSESCKKTTEKIIICELLKTLSAVDMLHDFALYKSMINIGKRFFETFLSVLIYCFSVPSRRTCFVWICWQCIYCTWMIMVLVTWHLRELCFSLVGCVCDMSYW